MRNDKSNKKISVVTKVSFIIIFIILINMILSWFLYLYIIPVCIFEIIFCLFFVGKSKLFYLYIVLNILCIVLSIILYVYVKPKPLHNIVGIWNCYYNNDKYSITFSINNSNKFIWSKYKNNKDNYILGEYKIKKIDKGDSNKNVYYYNLVLDSDNYVENGKELKNKYHKEYDIAINIEEKKIVLASSDNMILKCEKVSNVNPIIQ